MTNATRSRLLDALEEMTYLELFDLLNTQSQERLYEEFCEGLDKKVITELMINGSEGLERMQAWFDFLKRRLSDWPYNAEIQQNYMNDNEYGDE